MQVWYTNFAFFCQNETGDFVRTSSLSGFRGKHFPPRWINYLGMFPLPLWHTVRVTSQHGRHQRFSTLIFCLVNNSFGANLGFKPAMHSLRHPSVNHCRGRGFSGYWLVTLPITANCEAVHIAVGLSLCVRHKCRCGTQVYAQARQVLVCKKVPGKIARH